METEKLELLLKNQVAIMQSLAILDLPRPTKQLLDEQIYATRKELNMY